MNPEILYSKLKIKNPWPVKRPNTKQDPDERCFNNKSQLNKIVKKDFLILELGSWLGASTRFLASGSECVIAVDHWLGSPEHQPGGYAENPKIKTLYETFIANCWDWKDKIVPLKMTTADGVNLLIKNNIIPDMVYVDADHSYEGCLSDIRNVYKFGKSTIITGDDFQFSYEVKKAVSDFAKENNLIVCSEDNFWMLIDK